MEVFPGSTAPCRGLGSLGIRMLTAEVRVLFGILGGRYGGTAILGIIRAQVSARFTLPCSNAWIR